MECPICYNDYTLDIYAVKTVCHHVFCCQCAGTLTQSGKGRCPMCRHMLRKGEFQKADFSITTAKDTCTQHTDAPAVNVCTDCMRLLCQQCSAEHSTQHKMCLVHDAKERITSIIAPAARAKRENVKLTNRKHRETLSKQMQQQEQSIVDFGDQMKSMVDRFLNNPQQSGDMNAFNLQEFYESLADKISDFHHQVTQPRINSTQETDNINSSSSETSHERNSIAYRNSNDSNSDDINSNNNNNSNYDVDSSNISANDVDTATSTSTADEEYIDDLVYGLLDDYDEEYYEEEADDEDTDDTDDSDGIEDN